MKYENNTCVEESSVCMERSTLIMNYEKMKTSERKIWGDEINKQY